MIFIWKILDIQILQVDNDGEFSNNIIEEYCGNHNIIWKMKKKLELIKKNINIIDTTSKK